MKFEIGSKTSKSQGLLEGSERDIQGPDNGSRSLMVLVS